MDDLICSPSCVVIYASRKIGFICYVYSITMTSVMSFERFMGVLYPFVHRVKVTKARLLKYVVSVCFVQTLLYSFSFINGIKITRPLFVGNVVLCLAFTVFAYAKIFCARIKNNRFPLQQAVNVTERNDLTKKGRLMKELKMFSCSSNNFYIFFAFNYNALVKPGKQFPRLHSEKFFLHFNHLQFHREPPYLLLA